MPYDISYEYDACGNRIRKVDNLSGQATTYTYDAANQLTSSQTGAATTNYMYDEAGNLVSDGAVTNTWDDENRRTKADLGGGQVVTMTYNGHGLRVKKEEPATTTKFVWDDQNLLLETNASDIKTALNTYKPDRYGSLISRDGPGGNVFFHFDALGSTVNVSDVNQLVIETYLYEAFGALISANSFRPPFLFVGSLGYYYDELTSSYYVRARHYSAALGRFLSRDPLDFLQQSTLFYGYVANAPTGQTDPSGLTISRIQFDRDLGGVSNPPGFNFRYWFRGTIDSLAFLDSAMLLKFMCNDPPNPRGGPCQSVEICARYLDWIPPGAGHTDTRLADIQSMCDNFPAQTGCCRSGTWVFMSIGIYGETGLTAPPGSEAIRLRDNRVLVSDCGDVTHWTVRQQALERSQYLTQEWNRGVRFAPRIEFHLAIALAGTFRVNSGRCEMTRFWDAPRSDFQPGALPRQPFNAVAPRNLETQWQNWMAEIDPSGFEDACMGPESWQNPVS
jgi:RHS repeat-associated protein